VKELMKAKDIKIRFAFLLLLQNVLRILLL